MKNAFFLSLKDDTPARGYWDQAFVEDLLKGFDIYEVRELPKTFNAVVVIPARSHFKLIDEINKELKKINNVLLILTGDEEHVFPVEEIKHKNIKIWVQNPQMGRHDAYTRLGTGYTPQLRELKKELFVDKKIPVSFAGQITHSRREEFARYMTLIEDGVFMASEGFTKGLDQKEYYQLLASSKVAPCPSGPQTVDTFRLFEALELGCVPLADSKTPKEDQSGFWNWLFDEPVEFPVVSNWDQLFGYTEDSIKDYPKRNNSVQAWWIRYKRKMRNKLLSDYEELSGVPIEKSEITVIIPVSPIKSHPDTAILEETVKSIRHHLPDSEIIITFDGVREEQKKLEKNYNEFIRRALFKCDTEWGALPLIFDTHSHQVLMAKKALDWVKTPVILYCEQDTPLVVDYEIPFGLLTSMINNGYANLIRFHFEAGIPKEHRHLMIGEPELYLLKTIQWSQRPHLAFADFYRFILGHYFSDDAKCFIEDKMHGVVQDQFNLMGERAADSWKIFIYHPEGNIRRSYHTDGRAGEKKYDEDQIW